MPSPKSPEQVLWNTFPLLLVAIFLFGGILYLPRLNAENLDSRSRASEPKAPITPTAPKAPTPDIACAELYNPVCDPATATTYPNDCEANRAGIATYTPGDCTNAETSITFPSSN